MVSIVLLRDYHPHLTHTQLSRLIWSRWIFLEILYNSLFEKVFCTLNRSQASESGCINKHLVDGVAFDTGIIFLETFCILFKQKLTRTIIEVEGPLSILYTASV